MIVALFAPAAVAAQPDLLPKPRQARFEAGTLTLSPATTIQVDRTAGERGREIAELLRDGLAQGARLTANVAWSGDSVPRGPGAIALQLGPLAFSDHPEAYRLVVADGVTVQAATTQGLLWGVQTLLQSIETSAGTAGVRRGVIEDRPDRAWRGLTLDPARSFLDLEFIRRTIRIMSAYKMNVLHLHLIDDQAWRFETKAFPRCNKPGEPFYTQEELRELVAFAARHGIEVIPEFDVPGHSMTAVAAYPELDCEGIARPVREALMCAGKDFTREFIEGVVAEIAAVFPSRYLHLGADEPFAIKRWEGCEHCRARREREQLGSIEALYHTFVIDLHAIATRHGKQLIVWNDALTPGVAPLPPKDIIVHAWLSYKKTAPWAEAGYQILNSTSGPLYLTSLGLAEGLPLDSVLAWDATLFASPDPDRGAREVSYRSLPDGGNLLGGLACAWATEQDLMERRLYPRTLALAATLWSEGSTRGDANFHDRYVQHHLPRLRAWGVMDEEILPPSEDLLADALSGWMPIGAPAFRQLGDENEAVAEANGWMRSKGQWRDFVLTFEKFTADAPAHSGVFIRCPDEAMPAAAPAGFSIPVIPHPDQLLSRAMRRLKGWNRYELVARGPVVSLTVNGVLAWSLIDPSPRAGAIALQAEPGLRFRNVRLRPLEQSSQ